MEDKVIKEAKRLHSMGFAIHWLGPKSKRPIESGWTSGARKSWDELLKTYKRGFNVGVRLGEPSKVDGAFLAVIDVDVKSSDPKHGKEVLRELARLTKGAKLPEVKSGRGNGSKHYYILTDKPLTPVTAVKSPDVVKVHMPSAFGLKPSKRDLNALTAAEIKEGYRMRPAWEIGIMGQGQQVVLPPSIHPDSGKSYAWQNDFDAKLAHFELPNVVENLVEKSAPLERTVVEDFEAEPVKLSNVKVSDKIKAMIETGEGVEDRSAMLLPVCHALVRAGLTKNQILTLLTNPKYFLGSVGYDHAKTNKRERAAKWVWKYTLEKVMRERDLTEVFREPIMEGRELTDEEKAETEETLEELEGWASELDTTKAGTYRPTFKNCKLMLMNAVEEPLIGRNAFANQDYWLTDTPWGTKAGTPVTDAGVLAAKDYCVDERNIEFTLNTMNETLSQVAEENKWHPVRDYLEGLKWDGVSRAETWLKDYAGAEAPEPYLSDVSRKILVAMVKRIMEPGCKFDHVLILEGKQGGGKSSIVRALAGQYFSDAALIIGDKDGIMNMQSKWVIELGELSTMNMTDVNTLKAFVTQTHDRMRPPYGRRTEEFPRQSIFIGTTNNENYLKDPTGGRRWWPVKVSNDIDWTAVEKIRDQLFAEAFVLYGLDEPLYLDREESKAQAEIEQHERSVPDEWGPVIRDILQSEGWTKKEFELKDLAELMTGVGAQRMNPHDTKRITNCLKRMGYEMHRESAGKRRRLWKK